MSSFMRRRVQALVLLAVLVLSLVVRLPGAPKADAAIHNVYPSDVDGFPKDRFRADEALFVSMTSDTTGGTVCVVPASVTDPSTADCVEPPWGSAKPYLGIGSLLGYPFYGGSGKMLRPGKWRLLTTVIPPPAESDMVTQAAVRLNLGARTVYAGTEVSDVFEVVSCSPTCNTTVADSQLAPWKAMALAKVPSALAENVALAWDIVTRTYKIAEAFYGGIGFGLGRGMMAAGFAGLGFDFVIPSTEDIAKRVYKQVSYGTTEMYKGIAADPPDPNFGTVASPVFTPPAVVTPDATVTAEQAAYLNAYFDAQMRVAAYGTASRIANERYMGAVAAGNHGAAAMQSNAAADFTFDLIKELRDQKIFGTLVATFDWTAEPIIKTPNGEDPATWWANQVTQLASLTPASLSAADRQKLIDHGLTNAQVDQAIARWSDPAFLADVHSVDPTMTLRTAINNNLAGIDASMAELNDFGMWMSLKSVDEKALAPPAPLADGQTVSTFQGQAVPVTLTGSATGGNPITFAVTANPTHGTLTGTAPNLTYTPTGGYLGNDSFTFTTNDGTSTSDPATVSVVVAPKVNHPPVANAQNVTVFQDETVPITLTGSDPDSDPITYTVTANPAHGTLTGTAPNLTYKPAAGYSGADSLTFTTSDGTLTSPPATVAITVAMNHPPVASDATVYNVVPGLPQTFTLSGSDPDGRPITYSVVGQPGHGTVTGVAPNLTFTANDTFASSDTLTFTTFDGVYTSAPATVTFVPAAASAQDDVLTVQGSEVIDVTANDSPTGASVVNVTSPAHGTVTCSPYGMCLYVAEQGYVGADSFDYTLKVGSNTSTAKVTVTVVAPAVLAKGKPSASDDVLQTPAGVPGTVDVLANDTGNGTLTATPSDGEHGTVTCTTVGVCTYTPTDPAFVGFDVFSYTLSNGTDVDTGLVRVRVGTTPTGLSVFSQGLAGWLIRLVNGGPVETGLSRSGPVTATPSGPHGYVAGSAQAADGWNLSDSGGTVTATPGPGALIGDQATSILPRPLPPISQGTGGDGHVPILVGSKVFAFFHHQYPTQVTCVDRSTGQLCPGYPKTLSVGTHYNPGPGAVVGTQIWVHLYAHSYQTSGLYCWDTTTNQTCGMVTNQPGTESWAGTAPLLIGGKLWFGTNSGRLRCVDPTTSAPCSEAPIDTGITFSEDYGDIVNHGTKVYVSNATNANCVDVATGARCTGWPQGGRNLPGNLVRSHNGTTGAVDGVCGVGGAMYCVRDADPTTVVTTNVPWPYTETNYSSSVEAEAGTRTFWGSNNVWGLGCFDWSTMALCTGPAFDSNGYSRYDIGGNYLYRVYGTVWDGSCAVALGDPGQLFTMDINGNSPCSSLDSGAAPLKIDLRRQRFDQKVGAATWNQVRVFNTDLKAGTNFTSFVVTIRDGVTGAVVVSQEMIGTDGILDLSAIDPSVHPSVTVGAISRSVDGGVAWAKGNAPKVQLLWNADAAPLGFQTASPACLDGPTGALVVTSKSGDQTAQGQKIIAPLAPCTPPTTTTTSTTSTTMPATTTTMPGTTPTTPTLPSDPGQVLANQTGLPSPIAVSPQGNQENALPRTGTDAWRLTLIGGIVFMLGAAIVLAARRRRVAR